MLARSLKLSARPAFALARALPSSAPRVALPCVPVRAFAPSVPLRAAATASSKNTASATGAADLSKVSKDAKDATTPAEGEVEEAPKKEGIFSKFKKYGAAGGVSYSVLYGVNFAAAYAIITATDSSNKLIDALAALDINFITELLSMAQNNPTSTDLIAAMVATDLCEPVRLPLSLFVAKKYVDRRNAKLAAEAEAEAAAEAGAETKADQAKGPSKDAAAKDSKKK